MVRLLSTGVAGSGAAGVSVPDPSAATARRPAEASRRMRICGLLSEVELEEHCARLQHHHVRRRPRVTRYWPMSKVPCTQPSVPETQTCAVHVPRLSPWNSLVGTNWKPKFPSPSTTTT